MKHIIISMLFFSIWSNAARIHVATWNPKKNIIAIDLFFQGGCQPHSFTVQWDKCDWDPVLKTTFRLGQILDSGWQDTCSNEQQQTIEVSEPDDGCVAQMYLLKATSSKEPTVVVK